MYHKATKHFNHVILLDSLNGAAYYNRALNRSKYGCNLDACKDLYRSYQLGIIEAESLYYNKCGYFRNSIEKQAENYGK